MTASEVVTPLQFVQLLADEQRWRLMTELARSDRKVGELTELLGKPQNLVSYHLANLREAGMVSARRSSADGRDTYYRAELERCAGLLREIGPALQPGLRLGFIAPAAALSRRRGRQPNVLFLCTGNSARSQMAAALLEHRSGRAIGVRSAGSHPKRLHPHAVRAMAERGIDIAGRASTHMERYANMRFDRVITLCDKVREICPEFPSAARAAHWSMPDPAAEDGTYAAFTRTADELEARMPFLIGELLPQAKRRATR